MLDRTQAPPSYPISRFSIPQYSVTTTAEGHPIYGILDAKLPIINIEFLFESGKASQAIPGTSYYAIKMLQEGTKTRKATQIAEDFESLGSFVEFGTSLDHCAIKIYAQSKHIEQTLTHVSDLLLNATFPPENFEVISKIRQQQIRQQMAKNSQYATLKFNEMIFGSGHPLGHILDADTAAKVTLEQVKEFFEKRLFSKPKVFITGDITQSVQEQIRQMIDRLATESSPLPVKLPSSSIERKVIDKDNSEQVSFRMGMLSLSKNSSDIHKLTIANTMLGGYFGSRLMKKIREDLGYTYGIYSTIIHTLQESYWMVSSELIKEHVAKGEKEIEKQIQQLAENKPSFQELDQLKNYLRGKLLTSLDSMFSKGNLIKGLKLFNLADTYFDDYLKTIDEITPTDICEIVGTQLLSKEKALLLVG